MTSPKDKTLDEVISLFEKVITSGPQAVSEEWFKVRLRIPHLRILFLLLADGPKRMSELACGLDVSMSGTTGLIDRLVQQNLVHRQVDPTNRRSVICEITEDGKNLATSLINERRSKWEYILSNLSQEALETVQDSLRLIIESNSANQHLKTNDRLQTAVN
tara:strand:- start:5428 stop:5910 length:483 start_codon:yes stop_codon:yes gene_type:complete